MLITMTGTTIATNGHTLAEGQTVDVGDEFGQHLIDSGIASAAAGREATATGKGREEQQKAQFVQNLEIAKRHGDVEAALRLDRINRGEEQPETGERPAIASDLPERVRPEQLGGHPAGTTSSSVPAETAEEPETRRRSPATGESARSALNR